MAAFVDWVMRLPPELRQEFDRTIEAYEAEKKMRYMTTWERRGLEKGLEKGVRKGEATMLMRLLARRFDGLPTWAVMDQGLPKVYTTELFDAKCQRVYQHVFEAYYGAGTSIYGSAA